MRAKLVENIENINFKRGQSSKKSLNLGSRSYIENWFKTYAPDVEYEIDNDLNIFIKGYLYLNNTKITSLPDNLSIGGDLYLNNTNIRSLPDNLSVGGKIIKDF